jgi:hypothetical protein
MENLHTTQLTIEKVQCMWCWVLSEGASGHDTGRGPHEIVTLQLTLEEERIKQERGCLFLRKVVLLA